MAFLMTMKWSIDMKSARLTISSIDGKLDGRP